MTRRGRKQGSLADKTNVRLIQEPKFGPTETERIALALLEKRQYAPREPKPVTLRKFSWEKRD